MKIIFCYFYKKKHNQKTRKKSIMVNEMRYRERNIIIITYYNVTRKTNFLMLLSVLA